MGAEATSVRGASNVSDGAFDRQASLPPGYAPSWHGARTLALAATIATGALLAARRGAAADWLCLPLFFLAANAVEWSFHRGPMHRPMGPRVFYRNHALLHHRAFEHDSMEVAEARELGLVMMPWYTMLLLFVLVSPIAAGAWWLRGPPLAGIFYLTAAGYFLLYETMHALYHLPERTLTRLGLGGRAFRSLRAHHTHHHRLERMAYVNFNVTFPIMDVLLGTKEGARPDPLARPHAPAPLG